MDNPVFSVTTLFQNVLTTSRVIPPDPDSGTCLRLSIPVAHNSLDPRKPTSLNYSEAVCQEAPGLY